VRWIISRYGHGTCNARALLNFHQNTAKVGLAINLESAGEEFMEQQENMSGATSDSMPPPF